jgi:putative N6-adenine-specific DNA methylase
MDPMCGSGTFSLEAVMIAQNIPPGFYREFAFMKWPSFRAKQWAHIKKTYAMRITEAKNPFIFASDNNPKMCRALQEVSRKYGFSRVLKVSSKNFFDLLPHKYTQQSGVIMLNPPFGMRLESHEDKDKFYREIIKKLKIDFKGWRTAILVPDPKVIKKLPIQLKPYPLYHGGLNLSLLVGVIK